MKHGDSNRWWLVSALVLCLLSGWAAGQDAATPPAKVYVPYEKLKEVFESEKQGVFLPYEEFRRLWKAAAGAPAEVRAAPAAYLISKARVTGEVGEEVARMQLELTVDILADGWVEVPIGLGDVAVAEVAFVGAGAGKARPLLRVVGGQYRLVTRGKGRRVLRVEFVRQLVTRPGLKVLRYRTPPAAISTLELLIPEENMKVDVEPMLAATTTQVVRKDRKATQLQAFLGPAGQVQLSWKPKARAAVELEPVVICEQNQHIHVGEAIITHEVKFRFDIRRRGVDAFSIALPADFRVTAVEGANISRWDIAEVAAADEAAKIRILSVKLFSPARESYSLTVKMERFGRESQVRVPLSPIVSREAIRRTGVIAITHSPRRSVEVRNLKNLARVDINRLPPALRRQPGVIAYRFITADYGGELAVAAVAPRITVNQSWALGVTSDRLELRGRLDYKVERAGVFQLTMDLPEPWEIVSLGPAGLVDDHQLSGAGAERKLTVLLKQERTGAFGLDLVARSNRPRQDAPVEFVLPRADVKNLRLYSGQLLLLLAEKFRLEVDRLDQFRPLPVNRAKKWKAVAGLSPAMAFEFRAIDRARPAGAKFTIAVKPAQVSAVVHRLVNIQPGSVEQEAVIDYRVLYAPVDTFYVKMPAALADAGVEITGRNIKEKPRIDELPPDQRPAADAPGRPEATGPTAKWAYYKVVLQSPVTGSYRLKVSFRRPFQAGKAGESAMVVVEPILAAGKLSDQSGQIAVAKAESLAVGEPVSSNLVPADAASAADLPYEPHRKSAILAFKYAAPPFALSLPVVRQEAAAVFTTIVRGAVIEQVLARDGTLNARAVYLLDTSRGDRLAFALPAGAKLFGVLLDGAEAPVEVGASKDERIVRLPPSAGQVSRFVLEISFGLDNASSRDLPAPQLIGEIPVQQTLWRVWVPQEDYVLAHDRNFSRLKPHQAQTMLADMGRDRPSQVSFKLAPQGRQLNFVRQGPPGVLSVTLVGREVFSIVVWAVILAVGAAMLKLCGFGRCLVILGIVVAAFVVRLFAPMAVSQVARSGFWSAGIVALLWVAHWMFVTRPRRLTPPEAPPAKPQAAPPAKLPVKDEPPPGESPADKPASDREQSGKEG